jgi:hypothetical protein
MRQAPGRPGPPPAPAVWALWADAGGGRRPATRPVWGVRSAAERSALHYPLVAARSDGRGRGRRESTTRIVTHMTQLKMHTHQTQHGGVLNVRP